MIAPARTLTLSPNGQAQFRFPYDPALQEALKESVNGVTWNGTLRAFTVRVRAANIRAIQSFARANQFVGLEQAAAAQTRIFAAVKETMAASRAGDAAEFVPPATLRGTLRPFQLAGVAYAVQQASGCLLADEMGLGKTVEAIATLEALDAFPAAIVCPASLKLNWQREFAAWLPHRSTLLFPTSNEAAKSNLSSKEPGEGSIEFPQTSKQGENLSAEILIINYDILPKHVDALRALGLEAVVLDEGHLLKSPKCQRTLAVKKLRRGVRVRLLLTGTPILNRASELISPLSILGRLDDLGGFEHFRERYCGPKDVERRQKGSSEKIIVRDYSGSSNLPELAARLRATCMVRRRKQDVLTELPRKQMAMLPVDLTPKARREYDLAQANVLKWVAKRAGQDPEFRALIAGLSPARQIAAVLHRAQQAVDRAAQAEELVRIEALKQISARGKLAAAEEWIANFLATGEKLVVFAWHADILAALGKTFAAPVIDGDTPIKTRQRMVDEFQAPRKFNRPLQLLNLQAGGIGLTLTAASNVLVLEFPWTPALLDQAIDRCHRIGQLRAVTAWLMVGRQTIDTPIWQILQKKRTTAMEATR